MANLKKIDEARCEALLTTFSQQAYNANAWAASDAEAEQEIIALYVEARKQLATIVPGSCQEKLRDRACAAIGQKDSAIEKMVGRCSPLVYTDIAEKSGYGVYAYRALATVLLTAALGGTLALYFAGDALATALK